MIKKAILISMISIIAVLLLFAGRFVTIGHVELNDRDADSFSTIALWMGVISGLLMIMVAFWTYRIHIVAGIIPFGVGFSALAYCLYLLWCQSL